MSNEIIYSRNLIVYEIVYTPWENNTEGKPWKYIGSTKKDLSVYFGQIRSKKWKDFWASEVKNSPQNFRKNVLCNCITDDKKDLLQLELDIQKEVDAVKSSIYFNAQYAAKNGYFGRDVQGELNPMHGVRRSDEWKEESRIRQKRILSAENVRAKMSKSQKITQNNPEIASNKQIKQSDVWKLKKGKIQNSIATQYQPSSHYYVDTNAYFCNRKELFAYCSGKGYMLTFVSAANSERELEILNELKTYGLFKTHQNKFIAYVISDRKTIDANLPSENSTMTKIINKQFNAVKELLEELITFQSPKLLQHLGLYQELK